MLAKIRGIRVKDFMRSCTMFICVHPWLIESLTLPNDFIYRTPEKAVVFVETMSTSAAETPEQVQRSPLFVTTHWSVVLTAKDQDSVQSVEALETLCRTYWPPLYSYVRRRGYAPADAEDLTQEFFTRFMERNWLGRADQQRGRFRSFLLTSISNFLANEWDKVKTQKRGGGLVVSLQGIEGMTNHTWEPSDNLTPEQDFEWRWAMTLLDRVMNQLSGEFERDKKAELFETLKPCLLGERTTQPYAALAKKLAMTESSVKVVVHRLRQRYRQLLRTEISNTVAQPQEVEEELRYLFTVLSRR